ncbi:MAG: bacillithiol biosynthesis deacetylase BshB1 [Ignavibacteria bacterium]|nr:bacillithiol biosynthesis deacetylase BshB1 [Ignavibacteria bacterium]
MIGSDFVVDVLAFGSHPDDIEISCGGSIAKLAYEGYKIAVVDMTPGQFGTRGNPELRIAEAEAASKVLGLAFRENLELEDGNLAPDKETILKTIIVLRKYRPKIVLMSPDFERHPDHEALHKIVRKAMFLSGLQKVETEFNGVKQIPWRIRKMYCYMQYYPFPRPPDFFVDISDFFEIKMNSIKCYSSQVYVEGKSSSAEPTTLLSRPEFLEELESRARYFGSLIGTKYAEAFLSVEPLGLFSLSCLF